MKHILIIDDEEAVCWALKEALSRKGHQVQVSASAEKGLEMAQDQVPDAMILDIRLPKMDGLTALSHFQKQHPGIPIIIITAHGNLDTAVQAVEGGAFDYLTKPFDLSQVLETVERALQQAVSEAEKAPPIAEDLTADEIIGRSPAMQAVFKRIALVAPHDSCALITGESGTGKELVARAIHRHSKRRNGPFLPIHIAALNPSLVESELFGHNKGAFTGATESRPGLLALAEGGTVFLDELADIPLSTQVKLLRALEQNEVFRVGSNKPEPLRIRILAATNQDLTQKVTEGQFRHDLFFRLNVFQVELPPLRERLEDIPLLIQHFLQRFQRQNVSVPSETITYLQAQNWLGNVRELRNALEHAVIVARGERLLPEHFPRASIEPSAASHDQRIQDAIAQWLQEQILQAGDSPPENLYGDLLQLVESGLLEDVMRRVNGNRWVAAQWLGLNRATVRKKLATYDLTSVHEEEPEPKQKDQ